MEELQALIDHLDAQLANATRLASNRSEHLRLQQMTATVTRLRSQLDGAELQLAG